MLMRLPRMMLVNTSSRHTGAYHHGQVERRRSHCGRARVNHEYDEVRCRDEAVPARLRYHL